MSQFIMSSSSTPTEHSADESGYVTSRPRRDPPIVEEEDPSEASDEANSGTPIRSPVSVIPPPVIPSPAPRGPRVRVTARKSVPLPRRVTFATPSRTEGETSGQRAPSETPPIVTGLPASLTQGMTPAEGTWVRGMEHELYTLRSRMDQHHYVMGNLTEILDAHNRHILRVTEAANAARRIIRRLYECLLFGVIMIMVVGLSYWMAMQ